MRKLICMSFDGDYITEGEFNTEQEAWDRAADMGSRWFFYPFHFVTTESGKTIVSACTDILEWTEGKRVSTIAAIFKAAAGKPENQEMGPDEFIFAL